ncbi:MAG TPA: CBS domain-containing protein [Thermoanaerobaculia bacterium]|nr:CBS domain-containing protein [Thermoanaerobaculia bacterium]
MSNETTGKSGEKVRDVMTPNPQTVTEKESLQVAAKTMLDEDCGSLPVVDQHRKVIGMVTDRDIVIRVVAQGRNPAQSTVSDAMTKSAFSVHEEDSLDRVFDLMSEKQVRRLPVVNQKEEIVGIIAQADLATEGDQRKRLAKTVEEISQTPSQHGN